MNKKHTHLPHSLAPFSVSLAPLLCTSVFANIIHDFNPLYIQRLNSPLIIIFSKEKAINQVQHKKTKRYNHTPTWPLYPYMRMSLNSVCCGVSLRIEYWFILLYGRLQWSTVKDERSFAMIKFQVSRVEPDVSSVLPFLRFPQMIHTSTPSPKGPVVTQHSVMTHSAPIYAWAHHEQPLA